MSDDAAPAPAPIVVTTWTSELLAKVGFTPEAIRSLLIGEALDERNVTVFAIVRLAERVYAMESYLRAKIASERHGGRIILPRDVN